MNILSVFICFLEIPWTGKVILKHFYGTGMLGRILFAWVHGSGLDCDCKKWRLFADVLNDAAIFLDLVSQYFHNYFTFIMCVSSVSKSVVGIAGGATRAALTQHQARRNNMADVSAKDNSQETLVNLSALICSLLILPVVSGNDSLIWTLFLLFTTIHLYANYCAVTAVVMETFNITRYQVVVSHYLKTGELLSVPKANSCESVWLQAWPEKVKIFLGSSLKVAVVSPQELVLLKKIYQNASYLLTLKERRNGKVEIHILLHHLSNNKDQLEALFQACVLQWLLLNVNNVVCKNVGGIHNLEYLQHGLKQGLKKNLEQTLKLSRYFTQSHFGKFISGLVDIGWITQRIQLGTDEWRFVWSK
ncbi:RUS1 family protein C16orf58-like isoform X2 [Limulus polyphemus]|uniref:RUS1 family protein C16orf58-like isoform X2 n=1 Tax=Limulus polyphemus TaxID=6850 RepID=A0ABM1T288_LIMPO|nr:RUS1 family protein C16orf58-like isoform X2 [Limulus polyphemus]